MNESSFGSTLSPLLPRSEHHNETVILRGDNLTIDEVVRVARHGAQVLLTNEDDVLQHIKASCDFIAHAVEAGEIIYGVTTGFGGMANVMIASDYAAELQNNAIWYHKSGAGRRLPIADVRAGMLLRANSHLCGVSGIRFEIIQRIKTFLNARITLHGY